MKTTPLLSSAILLASRTVLAQNDENEAAGPTQWSIVDLSASATPHGSQSQQVDFSMTVKGPDTIASCYGTANSYQTLGSLSETTCEPAIIRFSWTQVGPGEGDGAFLQVFDRETSQRASHKIPRAEIAWRNEHPNPTGRIQVYVGPPNFFLSPINSTDDGGWGYGGDNGDSCERN